MIAKLLRFNKPSTCSSLDMGEKLVNKRYLVILTDKQS